VAPTIVLKDGKVALVTGSPGGSTIITTVLQVLSNVVDQHMSIIDAVAAPRLHQQWLPDAVFAEERVPAELVQSLESRGNTVIRRSRWGSANSIEVTPQGFAGAADPRTRGSLATGY